MPIIISYFSNCTNGTSGTTTGPGDPPQTIADGILTDDGSQPKSFSYLAVRRSQTPLIYTSLSLYITNAAGRDNLKTGTIFASQNGTAGTGGAWIGIKDLSGLTHTSGWEIVSFGTQSTAFLDWKIDGVTQDANTLLTEWQWGEAGTAYTSGTISGNIGVGAYVTGSVWDPSQLPSCVFLPPLQAYGTGTTDVYGNASIILPHLTLTGVGTPSIVGAGFVGIPLYSVSATGYSNILGNASLTIPKYTLQTSVLQSIEGNGSFRLPTLSASGNIVCGVIGNGAVSIPILLLNTSGFSLVTGNGLVHIPMLKINAAMMPLSYASLVVNIRNKALTAYQNYNFNSLCRFNGKNLGASNTGIFDLEASDMDGLDFVDWNIRTGYIDLHQKAKKRLKQVWFSYSSNGDLILTAIQMDGVTYEYPLDGIYMTETGIRVKIGKGIKHKYLALDLKNVDGASLDLDVIKLHFDQFVEKKR